MRKKVDLNDWDKYSNDLRYLFTGIEDGLIKPSRNDMKLYHAFKKWIEETE